MLISKVLKTFKFIGPFRTFSTSAMANSKFTYVRQFEMHEKCLPNCWIVVRVDGRNFHRFSDDHEFDKPNDENALQLMIESAKMVMKDFKDILISYGQSDEFSFVFNKDTNMFDRRSSKLMSTLVSLFSSTYTFLWSNYFPNKRLLYPPSFDGRVTCYPSNKNIRDYLSWRQADCHINNLQNTCFWKMVKESGMLPRDAQTELNKMMAKDKQELLFSKYNTNYNNIPEIFRKGTVIIRQPISASIPESQVTDCDSKFVKKGSVIQDHQIDIIGNKFWEERPYLLSSE